MKVVVLLLLVGLASCQFKPSFHSFQSTSDQVHETKNGIQYHYSWIPHKDRIFTWGQASSYCQRLGNGWSAVGIASEAEKAHIHGLITGQRLKYIWTGGKKAGNGWRWENNDRFHVEEWSNSGGPHPRTGRRGPQPDNREGNEICLAILNNFYNDGVKWHDVACHHKKPVVCERS